MKRNSSLISVGLRHEILRVYETLQKAPVISLKQIDAAFPRCFRKNSTANWYCWDIYANSRHFFNPFSWVPCVVVQCFKSDLHVCLRAKKSKLSTVQAAAIIPWTTSNRRTSKISTLAQPPDKRFLSRLQFNSTYVIYLFKCWWWTRCVGQSKMKYYHYILFHLSALYCNY